MNREIERLNRRLGESLGLVCGGTLPRYRWAWAPDMPYWSRFLSEQWVMTHWDKPNWTEERWTKEFEGRYPYPANGMYHAYCEWALPVGVAPTGEFTQKAIRLLGEQMETDLERETRSVTEAMQRQEERFDGEWTEFVQNQNYSALDEFEMVGAGTAFTSRD